MIQKGNKVYPEADGLMEISITMVYFKSYYACHWPAVFVGSGKPFAASKPGIV